MPNILMGPVLSFRGFIPKDQNWRVTAMIVLPKDDPTSGMQCDGKTCDDPVELITSSTMRVLRYDLTVTLNNAERRVQYGFVNGQQWSFTVPAKGAPPRMAYVSCNGFSDPKVVQKLKGPINSVWNDLLCNHDKTMRPQEYATDKEQKWHDRRLGDSDKQRFHLLCMGGDQLYFDSILYETTLLQELCDWSSWSLKRQIEHMPSEECKEKIAAYYLDQYVQRWSAKNENRTGDPKLEDRGAPTVMASIPTIMMWDDHDIIDGWGSYPPALQYSPVLRHIFDSARRAFWVFQLQQKAGDLPTLEDRAWKEGSAPADAPDYQPIAWDKVRAKDELMLPFLNKQPGFSYSMEIGPLTLIVPDLRTERSRTQILGESTWQALIERFSNIEGAEHALLMSSIPVAHAKLGLAELAVGLTAPDLKHGSSDDLIDHWMHSNHEGERKRLVRTIMAAANAARIRVSILSGDVHLAAWGRIFRKDATPDQNWFQVNQLTSSAVVHPSPTGVLEGIFVAYLNRAASRTQSVDSEHDIDMMRFPETDVYAHARRNWLALEMDDTEFANTGGRRLWATWRCERDIDDAGEHMRFSNHLLAIHPARKEP